MKVLQLCHKMPVPASDGGAQVMHFTTQALLAQGVQVKVVAINPSRNFINLNRVPSDYIKATQFEAVKVDTRIKPLQFVLNLFRKESYFIERFLSVAFEKKLESLLGVESFDIIQLEHLYLCKYIATLRKFSKAKIILRPQNIEYEIWERYLKHFSHPIKKFFLKQATSRLKKYEKSVTTELDGIMALTAEDAEIFKSFKGNAPTMVIPMGYDYNKIKGYNFETQFLEKPVVYHLGAMDWLPNAEAITWFLREVLPLIQKQNKEVKISLAGRNMAEQNFEYRSQQVEIIGEVTEPLTYQENKAILIVPLLSGSGIRAKIIEGLALGKTIISTSIGAQGIEYKNGENIIIADTAEEFARNIIYYSQSIEQCKIISKNARELSLRLYKSDSTAKSMIHFYNQILSKNE